MEPKETFSIAIVGFGGMGSWHADTIARISGMRVAGVYDIDPRRERLAASKGLRSYASLEELLADETVELVTIATPNDSHLPLVLRALAANKNVVCEKPVALNSAELGQMMSAAEAAGRVFSVHQNRRWDEDYLVAKQMYNEGVLGKVFNIESRVHGAKGIPDDWRRCKAQGGGMVLDWGVHLIDQLLAMIPDKAIKCIYAQLFYITCAEVDDGFRLLMEFEDGPGCLVEVGTSNFAPQSRWYMQGTGGTAVVKNWERQGEIVLAAGGDNHAAEPVVTAAGLTKTMAPHKKDALITYPLPDVQADIRDYYQNLREAVRQGAPLLVKPAECMRVMRVMERMFESAEKNQVLSGEGI